MADRIKFAVSATPIETIAAENTPTGDTDIIASEVGVTLGGGGDSIGLTNYSGTAALQGYLNATVNYVDATHAAGGIKLHDRTDGSDFLFVKNTGHKYSSLTALGAATTDCVMVAIRVDQYRNALNGGWVESDATEIEHYIEIAWLKPGQAAVFPTAAQNLGIPAALGFAVAGDLVGFGDDIGGDGEVCQIYVRTYESDGTVASDGNAVEYLCVT